MDLSDLDFTLPKFKVNRIITPKKEIAKTSKEVEFISSEGYEDEELKCKEEDAADPAWYVLKVDSRKINKVYEGLEEVAEELFIEINAIFNPTYRPSRKKKTREKFLYDGYIFINISKLDLDESIEKILRIEGVSQFVGRVTDKEYDDMYRTFLYMCGIGTSGDKCKIKVGDTVQLKDDLGTTLRGRVSELQKDNRIAIVGVSIFGRVLNMSAPVESLVLLGDQ